MPLADRRTIADAARLAALRETDLLDSPREDAFDRWTELTSQLLGVPTTLISLVDEHRQFFKSAFGLPEAWTGARETPLSHSFCQHAVASGEVLAIEDARTHPLVHDNPAVEQGVLAYAGAPLKDAAGRTLGVLCAVDAAPRRWTPFQLATLEALSKSVMNEIKLHVTIDRLAKSDAESRRQSLLLHSIVAQLDDPLAAVDMEGRVLLINAAGQRAHDLQKEGALALVDAQGRRVEWSERPIMRALRGETLRGLQLREEVAGGAPRWLSINAQPLRDDAGVQIGAISDARDVSPIVLAQEELRSLNGRLREQSLADELTGLYNRRGFVELATHELKVARRTKRHAAVFYVDLDGMKGINDTLGHEAGDAALLEAAAVLRQSFRDCDIPARMGGDEFALLALEVDDARAAAVEARLQRNVEAANRERALTFRIAMSCGWAIFEPEQPAPLADLLARADGAMYEAKKRRRRQAAAR